MNNEEIKTPEVTPEEPAVATEAPVEAPAEAPAAETPVAAPATTPVRAPITNPHKYFLLSNIFRSITVALLIVFTLLAMYLPVFKVEVPENSLVTAYVEEDTVKFSMMDVIGDLGDEFTLCFADELKPETWEKIAKIYENPGKFTLAIEAISDANKANTAPLAEMVETFEETRILILIPFFLVIVAMIFVVGLAINTIIRLIQAIIGWIKPSAQLKKTDASSCIVVTVLIAICYLLHYFFSCFTLNIPGIVILAVVSIGAVVMNIVYKKHTKEIVDAQFSL